MAGHRLDQLTERPCRRQVIDEHHGPQRRDPRRHLLERRVRDEISIAVRVIRQPRRQQLGAEPIRAGPGNDRL